MYINGPLVRRDDSPLTNPAGHPEAQPGAILVGSSVLFAASVILVAVRFWSRIRYKSSRGHFGLWWDDWMAAAAVVFFAPAFAFVCVVFAPNAGRHIDTFTFEKRAYVNTILGVFALLFGYSMFCARCSALLFYHRVFVTGNKDWFRWLLVGFQGFSLCVLLAPMSLLPFNCRITDTPDDRTRLNCLDPREIWIFSATASCSADILVALAPFYMISRLRLPTRLSRLLVAIPFACGVIVVAISLGRLVVTIRNGYVLDADLSFAGMDVLWWPIVEMAAALVAVCLPSVYSLIRNTFRHRTKDSTRDFAESGNSNGTWGDKTVTSGDQSGGYSPHRSASSSPSPESKDSSGASLQPSPPGFTLGGHHKAMSSVGATRPPPPPFGRDPPHELAYSSSGQNETIVTSEGRQPYRTSGGPVWSKVPKSVYYVPPPAIPDIDLSPFKS